VLFFDTSLLLQIVMLNGNRSSILGRNGGTIEKGRGTRKLPTSSIRMTAEPCGSIVLRIGSVRSWRKKRRPFDGMITPLYFTRTS